MASALQNSRHTRHNPRKRRSKEEKAEKQSLKKLKKADRAAAAKAQKAERIERAKARKAEDRAIRAEARARKAEARKASSMSRRSRRKESTMAKRERKRASRSKTSARRKYIASEVRKADAECRKMVQVKVMCPPKQRSAVVAAARKAAKALPNVSALQNRRRKHARRNVSALMNVSALQNRRRKHARNNGLMRMRSNGAMGAVKSYAMQTLPWVVGAAGGFAAHMAVEKIGVTKQIEKLALKIPTAGPYIASASHIIQGAAAAAALGMIAKAVGGKAAPYIKDTAISALVIGVVYDAQRLMKAKEAAGQWALPSDLGDLAFGDLAFNELGALAFGDLAFGDLGFNQAMSGYGDGMAYETAPLTADYSQASLGDAAYCGADFTAAEGQALINGRGHYMQHYGTPPHRMQNNPKGASHLAGREGHRWGWLMKMVGWEKACQIAALPPESRIKVLHKLRAAALDAFQREMQVYEAAQIAREIPEQLSDLVPSAFGAMGAQGAGELGDGALFMGA